MLPMIKSRVGNWSKSIVPVPLPEHQYIVSTSCFVLVPNARASSFVRNTMLINVQVLSALWLLADYLTSFILKLAAWAVEARRLLLSRLVLIGIARRAPTVALDAGVLDVRARNALRDWAAEALPCLLLEVR